MKHFTIKFLAVTMLGTVLTVYNGASAAAPSKPEQLFVILQGGKYGYINAAGKVIVKPQFRRAEAFSDGLAQVCTGASIETEKCGYIDASGRIIVKPIYDFVFDFSEGLAQVEIFEKEGPRTLFIDQTGKVAFDLDHGFTEGGFSEGLISFTPDDIFGSGAKPGKPKYGFIDKKGSIVIKPQFEIDLGSVPSFKNGITPIPRDGECIFINKKGKRVFQDLRVSNAQPFQEGLSLVTDDNEVMGYIDTSGRYAITPQFTNADPFSEGLAAVEINGKWGYINKKGALVIPAIYEETTRFSEGLAAVGVAEGKWAFIDAKGKVVIKPQPINYVDPFQGGLSMVYPVEEDDAYAYIDKQGKYVWKPAK